MRVGRSSTNCKRNCYKNFFTWLALPQWGGVCYGINEICITCKIGECEIKLSINLSEIITVFKKGNEFLYAFKL